MYVVLLLLHQLPRGEEGSKQEVVKQVSEEELRQGKALQAPEQEQQVQEQQVLALVKVQGVGKAPALAPAQEEQALGRDSRGDLSVAAAMAR